MPLNPDHEWRKIVVARLRSYEQTGHFSDFANSDFLDAANWIEQLDKVLVENERLKKFINDIAAFGLRTDMTPTVMFHQNDNVQTYVKMCDYFVRSETDLKARAKKVLVYKGEDDDGA